MTFPKAPVGPPIVVDTLYRYLGNWPPGCQGGIYRVDRFILDVPSYQEKVLVECVEGKDLGLWFTCSPWNFALRYEKLEPLPTEPSLPPEPLAMKVADFTTKGKH